MTNNLDSYETISKLDKSNILNKIKELPDQMERCWSDWQKIAIPAHFATAKNVLILGMGGSGVGAAIVASLARSHSLMVVEVSRDYDIPQWVDKNTLVIAVSFSGGTEETLEAFRQASAKTEKLITISTGGKLASLGSQHKALHYEIKYDSQPRVAIGFLLTSLLAIFAKLRLMEITNEDMEEAIELVRALKPKIDSEMQQYRNQAKLLAQKMLGRFVIVLGSGHLAEVARRFKGDINENGKSQAYFEEIPEMNHNALVGLEFPEELNKKAFFIILESKYNHSRNRLRIDTTAKILEQKKIPYEVIQIDPSGGKIAEIFQMIYLSEFTSFYLAILNNIDPEPVKIISFLKDKLADTK